MGLPGQSNSFPARTSKLKWRWIVRATGTLFLLFFLSRLNLDPARVLEVLLKANGWLVLLAVWLVFPFFALKGWRWGQILKDLGIRLPFEKIFRLYAGGMAAGSFTPGQSGDAIKAWYLKDLGFPLGAGLVSVVLDRLFDLAVLLLLASGGIFFLGTAFAGELPALLVVLAGTLTGLAVLSLPALRNPLLNFALKLLVFNKARREGNRELAAEGAAAGETLKPVSFLPVIGSTLLASGLALFRVWLLALSLSLNLSFIQVVAVSSLATAVSLVPVSVAGIGARDALLVVILDQLGYSKELAVSLSTLILLLNLVNLLAGSAIWFSRPRSSKPEAGRAGSPSPAAKAPERKV